MNSEPYLTHPIDTHIRREIGTPRAVLHLAGHRKEEIKVLCDAVELTDIFICRRGEGGRGGEEMNHSKALIAGLNPREEN